MNEIKKDLKNGKSNPRDLKRKLARNLVSIYHNNKAALFAEQEFDALFIKKDEPSNIPEYKLSKSEKLISILTDNELVISKGEARRMIKQGAVRINKEKIDDVHMMIEKGRELVLKVGKRKFLRIIK